IEDHPLQDRVDKFLDVLATVEPAVKGDHGHDRLLEASCVAFEYGVPADVAVGLLWQNYNPRCEPPWNPDDPTDPTDFERKGKEEGPEKSQEHGRSFGSKFLEWVSRQDEGFVSWDAPRRLAEKFAAGARRANWQGGWHLYEGGRYVETPEPDLRAALLA